MTNTTATATATFGPRWTIRPVILRKRVDGWTVITKEDPITLGWVSPAVDGGWNAYTFRGDAAFGRSCGTFRTRKEAVEEVQIRSLWEA